MQLAARFPITLISADSRQLYRGFDIGTAKPTPDEQQQVPHIGVDVIDPMQRWSAWQWAHMARVGIAEARRDNRIPVIVGGTGFYMRALTHPLAAVPDLDPSRREALLAWLEQQPAAQLRNWCQRLDPARATLGRSQWLRAIETALLTGRRLSAFHEADQTTEPVAVRYLVIDPGPALAERIVRRVHAMFEAGWTNEVRTLSETVPSTAPAWLATGYAEVFAAVRGEISDDEARAQVIVRTRQYAKRQRTWFRHQLRDAPVTNLSPDLPNALDQAIDWWRHSNEESV